jgi:peptidoglycan hydrolase-like protein with peptidoglycan-binding domain
VRARRFVAVGVALVTWLAVLPGGALGNPQQAGEQVALRALGLYCGPIDGDVGPLTVAAVETAQRRAGLRVTGRIDTRTRLALGPLGRPLLGSRVVEAGDFGLDVSELQVMLTRRGLYHGALDGYLGAQTERALVRFQARVHLSADGIAGPRTLAAFRHARAAPAPRMSAVPSRRTYVVAPGDTLTGIAARFGVSLAALARANRLDPARVLLIGTTLTVPPSYLDSTPTDVRAKLDAWAARLGVDVHLVRALAWMESGFQPRVVSSVGARGVLQLLPESRQFVETTIVGHPLPATVDGDIEAGVLLIRYLLREYGGNQRLALAAWYEGPGALAQYGEFKVTKPFVKDVLALEFRM